MAAFEVEIRKLSVGWIGFVRKCGSSDYELVTPQLDSRELVEEVIEEWQYRVSGQAYEDNSMARVKSLIDEAMKSNDFSFLLSWLSVQGWICLKSRIENILTCHDPQWLYDVYLCKMTSFSNLMDLELCAHNANVLLGIDEDNIV